MMDIVFPSDGYPERRRGSMQVVEWAYGVPYQELKKLEPLDQSKMIMIEENVERDCLEAR